MHLPTRTFDRIITNARPGPDGDPDGIKGVRYVFGVTEFRGLSSGVNFDDGVLISMVPVDTVGSVV